MKIIKAVSIYSITVPQLNTQSSLNFFTSPATQKHYFCTQEEADLYKKKHYPQLEIKIQEKVAAIDMDEYGRKHWILIKKVEDMNHANYNKQNRDSYSPDTLQYLAAPSLQQAINENSQSIFAVNQISKTSMSNQNRYDMMTQVKTTITYDGTDVINETTRFLLVSGKDRWFVNRGKEITLTDASNLKLQHDIDVNLGLFIDQQKDRLAAQQSQLTDMMMEITRLNTV